MTKKEFGWYFLFCLLVGFLQSASHALQQYGKTFIAISLLFFVTAIFIPWLFPKIKTWQVYLTLIPYFLVIAFTVYYPEDLPDVAGAVIGLSLGIILTKANIGRLIKGGLVILWISAVFWVAFYYMPNREINNRISTYNQTLPEFKLVDNQGNPFSTNQWKGKIVLVDLWYTKCGACLKQLKSTQELYEQYKSRPDVLICAVNCGYDSLGGMNALTKKYPYQFPYFLDQDTSIANTLNYPDFPRTLVIDKEGKLRYHVEGFSKEWESEYKAKMVDVIETLAKK
jgi:peroxiredoxin